MSKHKAKHRTSVAKRNPFGTGRKWWAMCTCGKWYQGCHEKADAKRMAAEHEEKENTQ